jgi:hypothetical protein
MIFYLSKNFCVLYHYYIPPVHIKKPAVYTAGLTQTSLSVIIVLQKFFVVFRNRGLLHSMLHRLQ